MAENKADDKFQYAVWYWQEGIQKVEIFDTEKAAAEFAFSGDEYGSFSCDGVQRSDGKTESYQNWPLVSAMIDESRERERERRLAQLTIPVPKRKRIHSPFNNGYVSVLEDTPSWVGRGA